MERSFTERVGRNLNRILYDMKVSQKELAIVVGVSEVAISNMVNGKKMLSAEKLDAVEQYLDVSHEELIS